MTYKLVILHSAKRELDAIVGYLCNVLKSPQAACSFLDAFDARALQIQANPELFAVSRLHGLAEKQIRSAIVANYIILFRVEGEVIYLMHVFHQSQNYARLV